MDSGGSLETDDTILQDTDFSNDTAAPMTCMVFWTALGGSYPGEVSWTLTQQPNGTVVAAGNGYTLAGSFTAAAGVYTLNMADSYGDGWNGATVTIEGVTYGGGFNNGSTATSTVSIDCDAMMETGIFGGGGGRSRGRDTYTPEPTDTDDTDIVGLDTATPPFTDTADVGDGGGNDTSPPPQNDTNVVDNDTAGVQANDTSTFGEDDTSTFGEDDTSAFDDTDTDVGSDTSVVGDTDTDCTVGVVTAGGMFPSEVSWTLTDDLTGTVVASGGGSSGAMTLSTAAGSYTLNMADSWGDGWNGGTVTIDGVVYGTGFTSGTDATESVFIDCGDTDVGGDTDTDVGGDTDADCTVDVVTDGGSWPGEVSWTLTDALGTVVASGDGFSGAATLTAPAGSYTLNMVDAFGDGWNGGTVTIDGVVYGTGFTSGTDATESVFIDCGDTDVGGDTDTDVGGDTDADCTVDVVTDGGSWPGEVSWTLTDALGTVVASGDGFSGAATLTAPAGSYTLNMVDAFGDGWNGGTVTIDGVVYGTGFTSGTDATESVFIDCGDTDVGGDTDTGDDGGAVAPETGHFGGGDADTSPPDTGASALSCSVVSTLRLDGSVVAEVVEQDPLLTLGANYLRLSANSISALSGSKFDNLVVSSADGLHTLFQTDFTNGSTWYRSCGCSGCGSTNISGGVANIHSDWNHFSEFSTPVDWSDGVEIAVDVLWTTNGLLGPALTDGVPPQSCHACCNWTCNGDLLSAKLNPNGDATIHTGVGTYTFVIPPAQRPSVGTWHTLTFRMDVSPACQF